MIGIYKIISPKGRIYVGQSVNIEDRWLQYKSLKNCTNQPRLYNSFIKYGVNNHKFEVLKECSTKDLNENERYWQEKYNVLKEGLNCKFTQTKDRSGCLSAETRKKLSISHKGKKRSPMSEETKKKISNSQKGKPKKNPPLNRRSPSEETKKKISLAKKGKPATNKRVILQIDLKGNIVREWGSITEAQNVTGFMGIATALTLRSKSSGSFLWKYKEDVI